MIFAVPALLSLALAILRLVPRLAPARRSAGAAAGAPSDARSVSGVVLLRGGPIALACAALQVYLTLGKGMDLPAPWRTALLWGTYAALAGVVAANVRVRWMGLVAAGLLLNALVMAANGGLMPVSPETLVRAGNGHVLQRIAVGQPLPRSKDVILPAGATRLVWLSDVLVLPGRPGSFSAGDVLIAVGIFLVVQAAAASAMAPARRKPPQRPPQRCRS